MLRDLVVLCYHGVSETWPAETSVRPADFERQLDSFARRGYRGATFSDALTAPAGERVVVVTFDDAHRSVLELAAPIMSRLGLPGTIFVPTGYAGSERPMGWAGYDEWLGTEHEPELRCLGWEELRRLAADGWEIGSHTRSHPRLPTLGEAEIASELSESRRECEAEIGTACASVAYPYGDYDDRVVRLAGEAGYRFGATVPRGPRAALPLAWPRVGVYHGEGAGRVRLRAGSRRMRTPGWSRIARVIRR
ncbi:MAG TPA: polysaccharide deacetylase family protein [Solirubrobacterales bacterium]|nr:polysaccharide deacetylase family protein [Solirubrobacterales bacterium]